jgi:predicted RNA-binding protein with TRAM domain
MLTLRLGSRIRTLKISSQTKVIKRRKKMSKSRQGGGYEGKRGHGKGYKRLPVELGEELEVEITELSPKGEGIARHQGFVIYVADVKCGERVKVKITRITKMAANAQVIK